MFEIEEAGKIENTNSDDSTPTTMANFGFLFSSILFADDSFVVSVSVTAPRSGSVVSKISTFFSVFVNATFSFFYYYFEFAFFQNS